VADITRPAATPEGDPLIGDTLPHPPNHRRHIRPTAVKRARVIKARRYAGKRLIS